MIALAMARAHPESISPTAHYTGYVWYAHGLSDKAFATHAGRAMYESLRFANIVARRTKLPTLEGMLIARHRLIDLELERAIEDGSVSQVVEVAAGLSPRGWRFRTRYGDRIRYLEADLPGMLANKQRIIAALGGETDHHRLVAIDALIDSGPHAIATICDGLDPSRGTVIITEGLVNYFDTPTLVAMWARFARALARFPRARYFSDVILKHDNAGAFVTGFSWLLSAFVRGRVHMHFDSSDHAVAELAATGWNARLLDPRDFTAQLPGLELAGAGRVRVISASAG